MMRFGLIGEKLGHSFSAKYFADKFAREGRGNCLYQNCELSSIEDFSALQNQYDDWCGWNVTIPYKERVIPYLDRLTPDAADLGAVNTIRVEADGSFTGHNTDHIGFVQSLAPFLEAGDQKALIFGTGGASKAVAYAFGKKDIRFLRVSRSAGKGDLSYADLTSEIMQNVQILVNATPLGMFPHIDAHPPFPLDCIDQHHFLIDLIYNPEETVFLKRGIKAGARTLNGLNMLHGQAEAAFDFWMEG